MLISQYVAAVRSYSSEYGAARSCSNVVTNIIGAPAVPFELLDHHNSTAFRTYGKWWDPSHLPIIGNTPGWFDCTEYIDLVYSTPVYPTQLNVHENYCPGTVVRVLVSDFLTLEPTRGRAKWRTIWRGEPVRIDNYSVMKLEFTDVKVPTMFIRLEFNTKHSEYYTQIDAVQLTGTPFLINEQPLVKATNLPDNILPVTHPLEEVDTHCALYGLPKELLLQVLSYLLLEDLCSVSRVSRLLHYLSCDEVLYRTLNLQPFYKTITNQSLNHLHNKIRSLQRLDISWVGFNGLVNADTFSSLLKATPHLTDLRLRCCDFVSSSVLETLATCCTELQVLDLSYCTGELALSYLSPLRALKHLNISHTIVPSSELSALHPHQLEWFLAGSPSLFADQNKLLTQISDKCQALKGVELWYWTSLGPSAFYHLLKGHGPSLVEVDIGWCKLLSTAPNLVTTIAEHCPKLEVLRVPSLRDIDNTDIQALIDHCPYLRQLDILGARGVTITQLSSLLASCPLLKYLDISYCPLILPLDYTLLQHSQAAVKYQPQDTSP